VKRIRYATRDELAELLADRTALTVSTCGDVLDQLAELNAPVAALVKIEVVEETAGDPSVKVDGT
jgi:hypothetical protein